MPNSINSQFIEQLQANPLATVRRRSAARNAKESFSRVFKYSSEAWRAEAQGLREGG